MSADPRWTRWCGQLCVTWRPYGELYRATVTGPGVSVVAPLPSDVDVADANALDLECQIVVSFLGRSDDRIVALGRFQVDGTPLVDRPATYRDPQRRTGTISASEDGHRRSR